MAKDHVHVRQLVLERCRPQRAFQSLMAEESRLLLDWAQLFFVKVIAKVLYPALDIELMFRFMQNTREGLLRCTGGLTGAL